MLSILIAALLALESSPELGAVHFRTDFEAAFKDAKLAKRPVFLLFDEVPGCATCRGFGAGTLSDLRLVEVIETLFEPVFVHNNRSGPEAELLARMGESAWNNPVVRLIGGDGRDLVERREGIWTAAELAPRMRAALRAAAVSVPDWADLVLEELAAPEGELAGFRMGCFWEGQASLGAIAGVLDVRPGFVDGAEAVRVRFDPKRVARAELVAQAARGGAQRVRLDAWRDAPRSDREHDLAHTLLARLPLTPLQAVRINSALGRGADPKRWLSPRQVELLERLGRASAELRTRFERPDERASLAAYENRLAAELPR